MPSEIGLAPTVGEIVKVGIKDDEKDINTAIKSVNNGEIELSPFEGYLKEPFHGYLKIEQER